jgi:predicted hotdog family 3-hydroxylacyl-ACP dehydratase
MAPFEKMIANEESIEKYIPQRSPMVMIGKLISVDGKKTTTALSITRDNIFVADGILREAGLIENMAQTAAAGAGYSAFTSGGSPRVGFIGGIKNLEILFLPGEGEEIVTESIVEYEFLDATVTSCRIHVGDRLCASCELKIFLQPSS